MFVSNLIALSFRSNKLYLILNTIYSETLGDTHASVADGLATDDITRVFRYVYFER